MMRLLFVFVFLLGLVSCGDENKSPSKNLEKIKTNEKNTEDIVYEYYKAYNSKDTKKLEELVTDDLLLIEMNHQVLNTKIKFIDLVKWGEELNATNYMGSLKEENGIYIIDEIQDSERIQFFYGKSLKTKTSFTLENGKISKINIDLIGFNPNKMNKVRNELMNWIKENHPDKLSNINKLNKLGGQTFKEAMKLFENKTKQ